MSAVEDEGLKGCFDNSGGNTHCSTAAVNSTEYAFTRDNDDIAVSDRSNPVQALKSETKTGDYVGVAPRHHTTPTHRVTSFTFWITKRLYLRRRKGTLRCYVYGSHSVARWR